MPSNFADLAGARGRLERAEDALRAHDPATFGSIERWPDKDLYDHIYRTEPGGLVAPPTSRLIVKLMLCRIDDYRAVRHGFTRPRPPYESAQEDIYEWHAQYLEGMVEYLGDGSAPPPYRHADEFEPSWQPNTSGS